jgi:hypothetical protein
MTLLLLPQVRCACRCCCCCFRYDDDAAAAAAAAAASGMMLLLLLLLVLLVVLQLFLEQRPCSCIAQTPVKVAAAVTPSKY